MRIFAMPCLKTPKGNRPQKNMDQQASKTMVDVGHSIKKLIWDHTMACVS